MAYRQLWKKLSPRQLAISIQILSLIAIFFEGLNQASASVLSSTGDALVRFGTGTADGHITDELHVGGITSIYYLGAIFGCFGGGWIADRLGRINGIFIGAIFACIGAALQAAATSSDFILVARVITGCGTGALTAIVPVFCTEVSGSTERGAFLGYVFIANYLGISVGYWWSFALSFVRGGPLNLVGQSEVRWRSLMAFHCVPALLLIALIRMLPDTPRYLASVGRHEEAHEVLKQLRGAKVSDAEFEREYAEICEAAKHSTRSTPVEFAKILVGKSKDPSPHLARRAWLCVWLQMMASWSGITAVTAYSPVLLSQAGYTILTQNGLAGGLNTIGIVGTIISAQIVDRFGRRKCLMSGSIGLCIVNAVAGGLYEGSLKDPSKAASIAPAAVTMLFLFNLVYAATWGTIAFLIPTEIFPSNLRAQGNGFGVLGWALGVGMTVLVNPIMFGSIKSRTYFLFAALNLLWIPTVYLFYPETKDRSLESIYILFLPNSPFNSAAEKSWREHHNGDVLAEASDAAAEDDFNAEKNEPEHLV